MIFKKGIATLIKQYISNYHGFAKCWVVVVVQQAIAIGSVAVVQGQVVVPGVEYSIDVVGEVAVGEVVVGGVAVGEIVVGDVAVDQDKVVEVAGVGVAEVGAVVVADFVDTIVDFAGLEALQVVAAPRWVVFVALVVVADSVVADFDSIVIGFADFGWVVGIVALDFDLDSKVAVLQVAMVVAESFCSIGVLVVRVVKALLVEDKV